MRFAKRFLMAAGTVALAGLIGTMLVPKAAQAVVSTLVSVVNDVAVVNPTPSGTVQPIIATDTDSLSRVPYQDSCRTVNENPSQVALVCFSTTPVPAGKRLVIEEVTAFCCAPTGKVTGGQINTTIGSSFLSHFLVLTSQDSIVGSPGNVYTTSELVHLYQDPGVVQFEFFSGDGAAQCTTSLSG